MPIAQLLNVYRHDRNSRALITLSGEIDLHTAPVVRASVERCPREGVRVIDIDLTAVPFCDCSGLNAFLHMSDAAEAVPAVLRLHFPCPMVLRLLTGSADRLLARPAGDLTAGYPLRRPTPQSAGPRAGLARTLDGAITGGVR
jgi:anti-sigma B factor antagonist